MDQQFIDRYHKDKKLYPKLFGYATLLFVLLIIVCSGFAVVLPKFVCWIVMIGLFQGSLILYAVAYGLRSYITEFEKLNKSRN